MVGWCIVALVEHFQNFRVVTFKAFDNIGLCPFKIRTCAVNQLQLTNNIIHWKPTNVIYVRPDKTILLATILFIHLISKSSSSSFEISLGYQYFSNFATTHFPISKARSLSCWDNCSEIIATSFSSSFLASFVRQPLLLMLVTYFVIQLMRLFTPSRE